MFYQVDDFTDSWTEPKTILMRTGTAKAMRPGMRGCRFRPKRQALLA